MLSAKRRRAKLLYLVLRNVSKKWRTIQNWKDALNRFAILWPGRIPLPGAVRFAPPDRRYSRVRSPVKAALAGSLRSTLTELPTLPQGAL
jgi:hypothetical protein